MRLICPHCRISVTIPDTAAGRITQCPSCDQPITVPALTGAAIDAAPEPVASSRPASNPAPAASRERERSDDQAKYRPPASPPPDTAKIAGLGAPWLRLTLRRDVAHWLAPAALVIVFLLTFFTWVAVAPNGNRIYTQNAWQAAFGGGPNTDVAGEAVMAAEADLRANSHWNPWLAFFLLLLIPAVLLAIADRILVRNPSMIPDVIRPAWPYRQLIIAGLCGVLLLFMIAPLIFGFGLEQAVADAAEKAVVLPPSTAEPTTKEKAERDVKRDVFIARFGLHRTGWLYLALAAQVVALAGAGLSRWLDRHPDAPDPRIEVYC